MTDYILDRPGLIVQHAQTHDEWLALRRGFVGGSDIAAIMGVSPWATEFTIWCEKLGYSAKKDTPAMRRGRELEASILAWTENSLKLKHPDAQVDVYTSPATYIKGDMGANLDGIAIIDAKEFGIEIKTTNTTEQWDDVPYWYYLQCQLYMYVCDLDGFYLSAQGYGWTKMFFIDKNPLEGEIISNVTSQFMALVRSKTVPGIRYISAELPYIKMLANTGLLNEGHDPAKIFGSMKELKAKKNKIEEEINELEGMLFASIGAGFEGERGYVSLQTRDVNRFDSVRFKEENPELYKKYIKTSTYVQIKEGTKKC